MKITLDIDPPIMARLKREAASQECAMSELVEAALRLMLRDQRALGELPKLPTFHGGGMLVEIADRDALYHANGRR